MLNQCIHQTARSAAALTRQGWWAAGDAGRCAHENKNEMYLLPPRQAAR